MNHLAAGGIRQEGGSNPSIRRRLNRCRLIRYQWKDGVVKIARPKEHPQPVMVVLNPDPAQLSWFDTRTPDDRQHGFLRCCLHLGLDDSTIYQAMAATEQLEAKL